MKVRVYVEGGGYGRELRARCREGFASYFEKATLAGRMPQIMASESRTIAFNKFRVALGSSKEVEFIVRLIDSEDPVTDGSGP